MAAKLGSTTPPKGKPGRKPKNTPPAEPGANSAAGMGHNSEALKEEKRRLIYRETDRINAAEKALAELAEQAKVHKTAKAQARAAIQKSGIPLSVYDERMEAAKRLRSENIAHEVARDFMSECFALPTSAEIRTLFDGDKAAQEGMDWEAAGFTARLIGVLPKPPVTGTDGQLWLKGWHEANKAAGGEGKADEKTLAEAAAEAIAADTAKEGDEVDDKTIDIEDAIPDRVAAEAIPDDGAKFPWGTVGARGEVVVLNIEAFDLSAQEDPTSLDGASFATLIEEAAPFWDAATRVLAFWGGKRRVLKEPGYEDTGDPDVDLSEVTELSPEVGEDAVLAMEAEPEDPANDEAPAFE